VPLAAVKEFRSELDQLVRWGAQQMLQAAIEAEVEAFLAEHASKRDDRSRGHGFRNGQLPGRSIMTEVGTNACLTPGSCPPARNRELILGCRRTVIDWSPSASSASACRSTG
jgi:hypothetical protein